MDLNGSIVILNLKIVQKSDINLHNFYFQVWMQNDVQKIRIIS